MDKLKAIQNFLLGLNFAHLLVLALVVKAIIHDISMATMLLSIPILGYEAYTLYLKDKAPNPVLIDAAVRVELDQIKAKLNASTLEKGIQPKVQNQRYF